MRWPVLFGGAVLFSLAGHVRADELEAPWGTHHGGLFGTAATAGIPYVLGEGPIEEAWRLDVRAEGVDRVATRNPITFDRAGNVYWKTSIGGSTGGFSRVASASPDGRFRWQGTGDSGMPYNVADVFDGTAVVVGRDRVYALGGMGGLLDGTFVAVAFEKATGALAWETPLPDAAVGAVSATFADLLTPVLYAGTLYVLAPDKDSPVLTGYPLPQRFHALDAGSGSILWSSHLEEIAVPMQGQMAFVANAFGEGEHGLYVNGDSGSAADGVPDTFGVRVSSASASLAWANEGGKVQRSHVIYSEETRRLYTPTLGNYGAELYTFDPVSGFIASNRNSLEAGHGRFDVSCLDFSGREILAAGSDGLIVRYRDAEGMGTTTDELALSDAPAFWGDYRVYGQLLRDRANHSVLITGTNSQSGLGSGFEARVVAIDVTEGRVLWEHNTGIVQDNGFTVRGGPAVGPDGKVYYFDPGDGNLVALRSTTTDFLPPCDLAVTSCEATADGIRLEWNVDTLAGECSTVRYEIRDGADRVVSQVSGDASSVLLARVSCDDIFVDGRADLCIVGVGEDLSSASDCCTLSCSPSGTGPFKRGDCNQDGNSLGSPTDGIFLLSYLFSGGTPPPCLAACDFNGDGTVSATPTDALYFFNFSFLGGESMPAPLRDCDVSTRAEDLMLGCNEPAGCAG